MRNENENENEKLEWKMRMTNKNDKWEWQMRMTNENEKWEWQMGIELWIKKKTFFNKLSNWYIIMNYYWFNRHEILQKAKEKYSKKKSC